MSGIVTLGVVLHYWLEEKSFRETFNNLIKNSIIREVSIFRDKHKAAIKLNEVKKFSDEMRSLRPDIVIAVDHEGGCVQRLRGDGFTALPQPDELRQRYEQGDEEASRNSAYACGLITAYELRKAGITVLYGPVFDTYNVESVVIGKKGRSYGNPPQSTDLLKHYLRGINGSLYIIAKHFPDHGQVIQDTHVESAIDTRQLDTIWSQSLPPYRDLNYDGLMIPHVIYSAVDELPATLSKKTIQLFTAKLAKNTLPLFSDALEMDALKRVAPTINESVLRCLESGCDAILYCGGGGQLELDYFVKLEHLLTCITEKKHTEPEFLRRYQEAEHKIKGLSNRHLNQPPLVEDYRRAQCVVTEKI